MRCPADRGGTPLLLSWQLSLPPCTEACCGLAFASRGLDKKQQETLNWEML